MARPKPVINPRTHQWSTLRRASWGLLAATPLVLLSLSFLTGLGSQAGSPG